MTFSPNPLSQQLHVQRSSRTETSSKETSVKRPFKEIFKVSEVDEKAKKKNLFDLMEEEEAMCEGYCAPSTTFTSSVSVASAISAMPQELDALFEKMAASMVIMNAADTQETTLVIDNPNMSSSPLFGTRITIKEFSTAPKAFNIEIASNPAVLAAIAAHQNDLMEAFKKGRFNFSVHRLDTEVQADHPVFCKKDTADQDKEDLGGNR